MSGFLRFCLSCLVLAPLFSSAQSPFLPKGIEVSQKFLFYLHGAIVQEQGVHAVSPEFGPYEYLAILDTLGQYGYRVVSEARPRDAEGDVAAKKVASQIDTLLHVGVAPENIMVVGASMGGLLTMEVSRLVRNRRINYVVLAICNDYNIGMYAASRQDLCGNFLSIYESSDQKGSCDRLLRTLPCKSGYQEVKLNMGLGHGFIYRPYPDWVHPIFSWARQKRG